MFKIRKWTVEESEKKREFRELVWKVIGGAIFVLMATYVPWAYSVGIFQ